ncbi:uncharacterized protein G2W53_009834 [Senna tora]|uniref:Uncharacterized protein n=1 Tax=Senna tora TaxID=362788 RepID=A0A835CAJ9_9FABA|nr:uncharacterized protein G2W53_009834 [Senna tora]
MLRLESSWRGTSVDHVITYFGRQIAARSQIPSRITRQKTRCASESNTSGHIVFANRSGFDATIGVVLAWRRRGSCLNIFRTTNRGRSQKPHELRGKRLVAQVSPNTSVRVVFANRRGLMLRLESLLAWEERGSCLNIFRTTNRGRILETFTNYEEKDLLRNESNTSVSRCIREPGVVLDAPIGVVLAWEERGSRLTYSGRQIAVGSKKPSRITRQKTCCASESNTLVRVVFTNRSGFDAPIGVVLAWESVAHVLTYSGRQIAVGSQKTSRITRQKTYCAIESNTSVPVVFANGSGFDAPIGVVLAWEERGSCLNIFQTTNRGRISETITNYSRQKTCCASESTRRFQLYSRTGVVLMLRLESSWHGRSVDHVLTYSG